MGAALALGLTASQTPLGQAGFDNANTSSNPAEATLDATNVGTVVSKFDTDLTAYGTVTNLGEPVVAANGNIIVTTDDQVVSVQPDGTLPWNATIPDAHPEIELALCRLADRTGEGRHLDLARWMLVSQLEAAGLPSVE